MDANGKTFGQVMGLQHQKTSLPTDHSGPLMDGKCSLHHLGVVVQSIPAIAEQFALSMSARWDGQIIHDPLQQVRVAFFRPLDARNPVFELVEPASETSPVSNFLKKRVGLHHVCYETDNLESALRRAVHVGFVTVSAPQPAVAFEGRRIAWVISKNRLLIEFLERHANRTVENFAASPKTRKK
ncbi:MAG TPA: VOC family protein [Terriglobales bacterium]|nr:VOC family protein [Terriglobales bacterium]